MTFAEILPYFKNHEYIRRKDWYENNVIVLGDDDKTYYYFKMFKDVKLPISGPNAIFPICEDDDWSTNDEYEFLLYEILADDWEVFDNSNLKECGFLTKHLNKATKHQLMSLMVINKMQEDFDKMSYEEKLALKEKYPDLIIECK